MALTSAGGDNLESTEGVGGAAQQVRHPDGRVDRRDAVAAGARASRVCNDGLAPVPVAERSWTPYHCFALWLGMAHNISSYLLACGVIVVGLDWVQALLTITLGVVSVLSRM